jgi:hypothetical protein
MFPEDGVRGSGCCKSQVYALSEHQHLSFALFPIQPPQASKDSAPYGLRLLCAFWAPGSIGSDLAPPPLVGPCPSIYYLTDLHMSAQGVRLGP